MENNFIGQSRFDEPVVSRCQVHVDATLLCYWDNTEITPSAHDFSSKLRAQNQDAILNVIQPHWINYRKYYHLEDNEPKKTIIYRHPENKKRLSIYSRVRHQQKYFYIRLLHTFLIDSCNGWPSFVVKNDFFLHCFHVPLYCLESFKLYSCNHYVGTSLPSTS